ncbi:hypothetical protein KL921_002437 [Ogataea angusta]|nr:hypothetical protein KL921_002437 [Ogataea angusta]KAG7819291.1 hypothetical protein KL909_004879 [Ogataea angusta]KAG7860949.1 hypothetical protein KL939_001516 [Ogataea angusta]KAG7862269.1 hypothetical protein KL919_001399 [Ogataea angusta]
MEDFNTEALSSTSSSVYELSGSEHMERSESLQPKQPILHDSLYCRDNPRETFTIKDDPNKPSQHRALYNAAGKSPTTDDLFRSLSNKNLKSVKSHAQLAKTAHGVRILARNLDRATIHLQLRSVMLITKARDNSLVYLTKEVAEWLLTINDQTQVYVDYHLEKSKRFDANGLIHDNPSAKGRLKYWTKKLIRDNPDIFDLVITLGGDGTVLYASTLFQRVVPPVMAFSLGSLGFLTTFPFENFRSILANVIKNGVRTNLRMRFTCRVHTAEGDLICEQQVLNELTVDRGPSPWVSMLELYGDGSLLTVAQADGLIIATPTGSTAYSLSAGGSLVHPGVSAISVTPICPHTLSFRPILLPDTMSLKVKVPIRSRATAWASFDGRSRVELLKGYYVTVCASPFPFPTVRSSKTEYIDSVSRVLNWNNREEQKSFIHLLSDKNKKSYNTYHRRHGSSPESDLEDEDSLDMNYVKPSNEKNEKQHGRHESASSKARFMINGEHLDEVASKCGITKPSKLKNVIKPEDFNETLEEDINEREKQDLQDELAGKFEIDYNDDSEDQEPTNHVSGATKGGEKSPKTKSRLVQTRTRRTVANENMSDSTVDIDDEDDSQNNYFRPRAGEEIETPVNHSPGLEPSIDQVVSSHLFDEDLRGKLFRLNV